MSDKKQMSFSISMSYMYTDIWHLCPSVRMSMQRADKQLRRGMGWGVMHGSQGTRKSFSECHLDFAELRFLYLSLGDADLFLGRWPGDQLRKRASCTVSPHNCPYCSSSCLSQEVEPALLWPSEASALLVFVVLWFVWVWLWFCSQGWWELGKNIIGEDIPNCHFFFSNASFLISLRLSLTVKSKKVSCISACTTSHLTSRCLETSRCQLFKFWNGRIIDCVSWLWNSIYVILYLYQHF